MFDRVNFSLRSKRVQSVTRWTVSETPGVDEDPDDRVPMPIGNPPVANGYRVGVARAWRPGAGMSRI